MVKFRFMLIAILLVLASANMSAAWNRIRPQLPEDCYGQYRFTEAYRGTAQPACGYHRRQETEGGTLYGKHGYHEGTLQTEHGEHIRFRD